MYPQPRSGRVRNQNNNWYTFPPPEPTHGMLHNHNVADRGIDFSRTQRTSIQVARVRLDRRANVMPSTRVPAVVSESVAASAFAAPFPPPILPPYDQYSLLAKIILSLELIVDPSPTKSPIDDICVPLPPISRVMQYPPTQNPIAPSPVLPLPTSCQINLHREGGLASPSKTEAWVLRIVLDGDMMQELGVSREDVVMPMLSLHRSAWEISVPASQEAIGGKKEGDVVIRLRLACDHGKHLSAENGNCPMCCAKSSSTHAFLNAIVKIGRAADCFADDIEYEDFLRAVRTEVFAWEDASARAQFALREWGSEVKLLAHSTGKWNSGRSEYAYNDTTREWHIRPGVPSTVCLVCFQDLPISATVNLGCGHTYCQECLNECFRQHTLQKAEWPPRCCEEILGEDVSGFLRPGVLKRYLRLRPELSAEDPVYCGRTRCATFICDKSTDPPVVLEHALLGHEAVPCPKCDTSTCVSCRHTMAEHSAIDGMCPRDWDGEALKTNAAKMGLGTCPHCNFIVDRSEGCNHVKCPLCNGMFCYACGVGWQRNPDCKCGLYGSPQQPEIVDHPPLPVRADSPRALGVRMAVRQLQLEYAVRVAEREVRERRWEWTPEERRAREEVERRVMERLQWPLHEVFEQVPVLTDQNGIVGPLPL